MDGMCICVQCSRRPEEGIRSSGSVVTLGCESPDWVLGAVLGSSARTVFS